jgi:2-polyprenyl-3-methyl-5-hydroxy-6-metoxy-1,4-benzoquinol methylase
VKTDAAKVIDSLCPVCGAREAVVFLEGADHTLDSSEFGSSRKKIEHGRILRCKKCRFGFSQFRPSDEQLSSLYRKMDNEVYDQELPGRRKTAQRHLRLLQSYAGDKPGHLLDVGCASGLLLKGAADAGWTVTGVEPSEVFFTKAHAMVGSQGTVMHGTLQEVNLPDRAFDAETVWDVLEHVQQPVEFLQLCASKLKPGGHLLVNVPNLDSASARLLGKRWPLFLAEHLNYFNPASLRTLAAKVGLTEVKMGQRPASFSLSYLFYRLAQHNIPGTPLSHRIIQKSPLKHSTVPVLLGEVYVVWKR